MFVSFRPPRPAASARAEHPIKLGLKIKPHAIIHRFRVFFNEYLTKRLTYFSQSMKIPSLFCHTFQLCTRWETTLAPCPQPQLQTFQEIYTHSIKISSSMSDSSAKFHEKKITGPNIAKQENVCPIPPT